MVNNIREKLLELSSKYKVADISNIDFEEDNIVVDCAKGKFKFFQTSLQEDSEEYIDIPLFHWRNKRRYIELRNILVENIVEEPVGMRVKHIRSDGSLDDLLIREMDLLEFILGDKIVKVFSSVDIENQYCNLVLSTEKGIRASMELGIVPNIVEPIEMHEIICRTGIASDLVVDTQIEHYPIYVYSKDKVKVYTDIDYELYGIENDQADLIRYILHVLDNISQIESLKSKYTHYTKLKKAVYKSNTLVAPVAI